MKNSRRSHRALLPITLALVLCALAPLTWAEEEENELEGDRQATSVPEPATLSLLVLGVAGLGLMRRRKGN